MPGQPSSESGQTSRPLWQTPSVAMSQDGNLSRGQDRTDEPLLRGQVKAMTGSNRLNPRFVEWLQGFPVGWTEPSA